MTATDQSAPHWVIVESFATCKRCGRTNLAWQQGKSGKWYLCEAKRVGSHIEANRRGFHKCQPAFKNGHGVTVSDADIPF
jgi:hypothetical protein